MKLAKAELVNLIVSWLEAWNAHNLKEVMLQLDETIEFENWTGEIIQGKKELQNAWLPWFLNHGNFKFTLEDIFADEDDQKILFQWLLEWPSPKIKGSREIRRGVDILHLMNGKIYKKYTYSKTNVQILNREINN